MQSWGVHVILAVFHFPLLPPICIFLFSRGSPDEPIILEGRVGVCNGKGGCGGKSAVWAEMLRIPLNSFSNEFHSVWLWFLNLLFKHTGCKKIRIRSAVCEWSRDCWLSTWMWESPSPASDGRPNSYWWEILSGRSAGPEVHTFVLLLLLSRLLCH